MIRTQTSPFRWEGVDVHPYKETGTHFRSITRQTLFEGDSAMPIEMRYFEMQPGGYSTLERHEHQHLVMVLRGNGTVLVGDEVYSVGLHDVVHVPPMTWHQFQASGSEPFGILCNVMSERDKPFRPSDMSDLPEVQSVREFVKF